MDAYATKLNFKYQAGLKTYNGLRATFPSAPDLPNRNNFSGLEALIITYINGAGGRTHLVKLGRAGTRLTSWDLDRGVWQFLPNGQNYVDKVNAEIGK